MSGQLPSFLLIGAMRAGTTSLHHTLASHPDVFMPSEELFFFDADDLDEHAEEQLGPDGRWAPRDFERELPDALPRYMARFDSQARLVGEDSTTYLSSVEAPARAARIVPDAKILVLLRDPVERAWSQYWHGVMSGRAVLDFEASLVSARGTLLKRSMYAAGLRRWMDVFPRDQIKVILSEELWAQPQAQLDEVCRFLGLDRGLDVDALPLEVRHRHAAVVPRWPALRRWANLLARRGARPNRRPGGLAGLLVKVAGATHKKPVMRADTRELLEGVLGRANAALPELLGRPLDGLWPCMRAARR